MILKGTVENEVEEAKEQKQDDNRQYDTVPKLLHKQDVKKNLEWNHTLRREDFINSSQNSIEVLVKL